MTWECIARLEMSSDKFETAFVAISISGNWVFRGAQTLFAWQESSESLRWKLDLEGDRLFGMKCLYSAHGNAITLNVTDFDEPKILLAVDPVTGRNIWSKSYDIETSPEGFVVVGESIFLHGRDQLGDWRVMHIDGSTGQIISSTPASSGYGLNASQNRLYLNGEDKGLLHTTLGQIQWQQVRVGEIASVCINHGQLLFFSCPPLEEEAWELVCWDGDEALELGRFRLDISQAMQLVPLPFPCLVAIYLDKLGLSIIDVNNRQYFWNLEMTDRQKIRSVVWTTLGLAVAIKPRNEPVRVEIRDLETGEILSILPTTRHNIECLYWLDNRLIVSATDGLESFSWVD